MTKLVSLGDVASLITKGTTPKTMGKAYVSVGVPFLRAEDVNGSAVDWMSARHHIDADTNDLLARSKLHPGDVLITIAGTIGRVGYVPVGSPEMNCNQAVSLVRLDISRALPNYICHVLKSAAAFESIMQQKTTATISNISLAQVGAIRVPLPSLSEQRRIVDILDRAASIQKLRQQAEAKAREVIPALFVDMFGDPEKNPQGWMISNLAEIVAEFRYGTSQKSGPVGAPVLRIPNVLGGRLDTEEIKFVDLKPVEQERLRLIAGDLLFVRTNGNRDYVGRCAVYRPADMTAAGHDGARTVYASYLIRARLENSVVPCYVQAFLTTGFGRQQLRERSKTSAGQYNINIEALSSIRVPVPPRAIQEEFSRKRAAIEAMYALHGSATRIAAEAAIALQSKLIVGNNV